MSTSRFAAIGAELKTKKSGKSKTTAPTVTTTERIDVVPSQQDNTRKPGKRKSGHVQISGLVPPATRDGVQVALVFDPRDLGELLTDLLNDWLAGQPDHVQKAIAAKVNS